MTPLIPARFEDGAFKPIKPVRFPEHLPVVLAVSLNEDDLPTMYLNRLAEESAAFRFLADDREDLYTLSDGEPC